MDAILEKVLEAVPFQLTMDGGPARRYGELLAATGVPVQLHNAETLVHGYLGYHGVVAAATEAADLAFAALRGALA